MAAFTMNCPACGRSLELQDEWRGMSVNCPACGTSLNVPSALVIGEDRDISIVAAPEPEAHPEPVNHIPLYMQQSECAKAYVEQRNRQNATNRLIRIVISLVVFCGVILGLWQAVRFTLFRSAGFAIDRKVDGVIIYCSGHKMFYRAEKEGSAFTGEVCENRYYEGVVSGFTKYTFDGGYLVSIEKYSVDSADNETLRRKTTARNGRIVEEIRYDRTGKVVSTIEYQYDLLGRVKSGIYTSENDDEREYTIEFNYHWYGPIESMLVDRGKDGKKHYHLFIFNSDSRVAEDIWEDEEDDWYRKIVYEYSTKEDETKGMVTGYAVYNKNGRKIRECTISYDSNYKPTYSYGD